MASACPHCGWPVDYMQSFLSQSFAQYTAEVLVDKRDIGQQITTWGTDAVIERLAKNSLMFV
jgi:hypothetical protein